MNEEVFDPEVPCLSVIETLIYLTIHTRPDISFLTYSLAKYNSSPIQKHLSMYFFILEVICQIPLMTCHKFT